MNTLNFAEYELKRYTAQMGIYPQIELAVKESEFDTSKFKRYDALLDDAFKIEVKNEKGNIFATNPRALLLGVYHFLKIQGCLFLRPGKDGEYIPVLDKTKDACETVYAKYRHRGTTDWGLSGGINCVFDYLDWLPKVMMNTYMIEHTDYYQDVLSRYRFKNNPYKQEKLITRELYNRWDKEITDEIKKRGLIRHGAGHGFTIMMMDGITETKTEFDIADTEDETKCTNTEILAEIDGKRDLFKGVPLNTNLCLSQEKVRHGFAQKVYEYSTEHPEIDYLHVWLADSFSNYCECENCRKLNQSDWYVLLLNEIDKVFTEHNSKQKIVFLVYFELLYPPKQEKIINEDRFVMLFCPFARDFTKSYDEYIPREYIPQLNKYTWDDMNGEQYMSQLADWKKVFGGECIAFDYSLYDWTNFYDLTNLKQTPVTARSSMCLEKFGIDGKIECGNVVSMSPTSLMLNGVAQGLFYGTQIDEKEYFKNAFGENESVYDLLRSIKDILSFDYLKGDTESLIQDEILALGDAIKKIREFKNSLAEFEPESVFCRKNYEFLMYYIEMIEFIFGLAYKKEIKSLEGSCEEYVEKLRNLVFRIEMLMPSYFPGIDYFTYMGDFIRSLFGIKPDKK